MHAQPCAIQRVGTRRREVLSLRREASSRSLISLEASAQPRPALGPPGFDLYGCFRILQRLSPAAKLQVRGAPIGMIKMQIHVAAISALDRLREVRHGIGVVLGRVAARAALLG